MLYRLTALLTLSLLLSPLYAQTPQEGYDWRQAGADALARGVPILVVVTEDGCGFCERLNREVLDDPKTRAQLDAHAVLRGLDREPSGKVRDFDGERVRARLFLGRYEVFATPTLLFLDPQGRALAPALVGYNDPESYRDLLAKRLRRAQAVMQVLNPDPHPALAGHSD
jgi:thioredoxin-related protein